VRRGVSNEGHALVFLPGMSAVAAIARDAGAMTCILHGDRSQEEQDRAVVPRQRKKVILATNVAESSLTIEGVGTVVDSGLVRSAMSAPWSGLPVLRVVSCSRASCDQRAGRAARTRNGRAIRLYTKADYAARPAHDVPEIQRMDLAQTVFELRAAGVRDLEWLDPPRHDGRASPFEDRRALATSSGSIRRDRARLRPPRSLRGGSGPSTLTARSPISGARWWPPHSIRACRGSLRKPGRAARRSRGRGRSRSCSAKGTRSNERSTRSVFFVLEAHHHIVGVTHDHEIATASCSAAARPLRPPAGNETGDWCDARVVLRSALGADGFHDSSTGGNGAAGFAYK
jgi:superfamily II DNA/RNA helicase